MTKLPNGDERSLVLTYVNLRIHLREMENELKELERKKAVADSIRNIMTEINKYFQVAHDIEVTETGHFEQITNPQ